MTDRATADAAFERIRKELEIASEFTAEVERDAEAASQRNEWLEESNRIDLEHIPFITIDPAGSRDLDQAVYIERAGAGYRVHYAIADVGCFVDRGSRIEEEAWRRGVTY